MSIIEEVFEELLRREAVGSAQEYSVKFLKKSYGYYACRRNSPSYDAIRNLYVVLRGRELHDLAIRVAAELLCDA